MQDTQAKYHHLVPQTYMKAWCHNTSTLYIIHKNNLDFATERNKEKIAGIQHYHSIRAGMVCCTQDDCDIIFATAKDYIIKYDGKTLINTMDMNKAYTYFDEWEVFHLDGNPVRKQHFKQQIDSVRIRDIEVLWTRKYENDWNSTYQKICNLVLSSQSNTILEFDKEYLMKFFVALDWRGFSSNAEFKSVYGLIADDIMQLKNVCIPEGDRIYPFLETAYDEMYHALLLKQYRNFLNESGIIFDYATKALQYTTFQFFVAKSNARFITSDNPVFLFTRQDDLIEAILPISPQILMIQCRDSSKSGCYHINYIDDEEVKEYNKRILYNAVDFIIVEDNPGVYF